MHPSPEATSHLFRRNCCLLLNIIVNTDLEQDTEGDGDGAVVVREALLVDHVDELDQLGVRVLHPEQTLPADAASRTRGDGGQARTRLLATYL